MTSIGNPEKWSNPLPGSKPGRTTAGSSSGPSPRRPSVLLIQPPVYDFALYDLFLKPYGLLRIGRWLEENGYEVSFLDCLEYRRPKRKPDGTGKYFRMPTAMPSGLGDVNRSFGRYGMPGDHIALNLERIMGEYPPDLVLISSGMTYWYQGVKETVEAVRRAAGRISKPPGRAQSFGVRPPQPGGPVPVAVGGIYASLLPEHCRAVCGPDHVAPGAAEYSLPKILEELGLPVPGGKPDHRPLLIGTVWKDAAVIRLNEGCPYSCDYCASGKLSPGFFPGDPGDAFGLVGELHKRFGTVNFAFYDDALLWGKEKVFLPFLEQVVRSGLDLSFHLPNAVHGRLIDGPAAGLMKKAGFREIRIGYESASDDFHKVHGSAKLLQTEFQQAILHLRKAGFLPGEVTVYVLAGLPGQRRKEVESTLEQAESLGVRVSLAEYSPVPGTGLWNAAVGHSRYPIAREPLFHNNTFFPMEWEGFTRLDLNCLKERVKEYNRGTG